MDPIPSLTCAAGLTRLSDFLATAGEAYAGTRNTDRGPGAEPTTSALSPYLRRRLLTEAEAVAAARSAFGDGGAEKFVSEVFWRTYFKGHLETHPAAWTDYLEAASADQTRLAGAPGLRRTHEAAIEGRTGIDGFDDWAQDLVGTGWVHNHARMWFASMWIFTLRLPWSLGAAFFLRHLVDGDPASNTLSWRWVAGLHAALWDMVAGLDVETRLSRLSCPTLVVAGAEDASASPAAGQLIADRITGAELRVIAECGHFPPLEAAHEFNAIVRAFLAAA